MTWTDPTPASWANVSWITTSIDCVSASTCWLTGLNGPFGSVVDPILLKTSDLGASWQAPGHLPGAQSTNPATAYALQDISCLSAASCVAVGGPDEVNGVGTVLVTSDGGLTWTRFAVRQGQRFPERLLRAGHRAADVLRDRSRIRPAVGRRRFGDRVIAHRRPVVGR